mgnify:CR=1 FL=1
MTLKRNEILGICLIFLGFLVLLVGEITNLERLYLFNTIYINQVLMLCTFYLSLFIIFILNRQSKFIHWLLFLLPISLSLIWSDNYVYGIFKLGNLYISSFISLSFFMLAIKLNNLKFFINTLITMLFFLLFIAIIYKSQVGFFDRNQLFFLSGPIVFGRLMGVGAALSLIGIHSLKNKILFSIFTLAVIWTASKGPIIALLITWLTYFLFKMSYKEKAFSLFAIFVISIPLINNLNIIQDVGLSRVIDAFNYMFLGNLDDSVSHSISIRQSIMYQSIDLFLQNPFFGVGVGGWAANISNEGLIYPHNFFLEVFSEGGLLLGGLFCVPYVIFLLKPNSVLFYAVLFLLISQLFSGDILDSRYWLVFSILSFVFYRYNYFIINRIR